MYHPPFLWVINFCAPRPEMPWQTLGGGSTPAAGRRQPGRGKAVCLPKCGVLSAPPYRPPPPVPPAAGRGGGPGCGTAPVRAERGGPGGCAGGAQAGAAQGVLRQSYVYLIYLQNNKKKFKKSIYFPAPPPSWMSSQPAGERPPHPSRGK